MEKLLFRISLASAIIGLFLLVLFNSELEFDFDSDYLKFEIVKVNYFGKSTVIKAIPKQIINIVYFGNFNFSSCVLASGKFEEFTFLANSVKDC